MRPFKVFPALIIAFFLALNSTPSQAATYQVDKDHTVVSFKIRSFASAVQGFFRDFQGSVDYDPEKPETGASRGTIEVKSINTASSPRDRHLLSPDFFDAQKFPQISFKSEKISGTGKTDAQMEGFLTIHGIEKPVSIEIHDLVLNKEPDGKEHLTFQATTKINRKDFGMTYSGAPFIGGAMLGDDVTITLQVDAVRD